MAAQCTSLALAAPILMRLSGRMEPPWQSLQRWRELVVGALHDPRVPCSLRAHRRAEGRRRVRGAPAQPAPLDLDLVKRVLTRRPGEDPAKRDLRRHLSSPSSSPRSEALSRYGVQSRGGAGRGRADPGEQGAEVQAPDCDKVRLVGLTQWALPITASAFGLLGAQRPPPGAGAGGMPVTNGGKPNQFY